MHLLTGFSSEAAALDRSMAEMERRRGGPANPADVTLYWWGIRKHPRREEFAVSVDDKPEDQFGLSVAEKARLKTEPNARAQGWYEEIGVAARVETRETFEVGD